jgi:hypothetical protein
MLPQSLSPADAITALALIMRSLPLTEKQHKLLDESLHVLNTMVQSYQDTYLLKAHSAIG